MSLLKSSLWLIYQSIFSSCTNCIYIKPRVVWKFLEQPELENVSRLKRAGTSCRCEEGQSLGGEWVSLYKLKGKPARQDVCDSSLTTVMGNQLSALCLDLKSIPWGGRKGTWQCLIQQAQLTAYIWEDCRLRWGTYCRHLSWHDSKLPSKYLFFYPQATAGSSLNQRSLSL